MDKRGILTEFITQDIVTEIVQEKCKYIQESHSLLPSGVAFSINPASAEKS